MKKFFKRLIILIILIIIAIIGIFTYQGYSLYKEAINEMSIKDKISEIKSGVTEYIEYEELPENYINAVIAVEDRRFFSHNGVDAISITRAIVKDIQTMSLAEGGSTITQQLAKNIYFTQEKKFTRKFAEMFMAFKIESSYSKDEILELYLNTSYFGDGYYTIKEACLGYFDKQLNEMTYYEMILLAGIPNAPTVYAPTKNPELARQRQKQVIDKMVKYKYLTEEDADKILNEHDEY